MRVRVCFALFIITAVLLSVVSPALVRPVEAQPYWLIETVQGVDIGAGIDPGNFEHYTSIDLDSSGQPHVSYRILTYTPTTDPYVLRYSSRTGTGGTWVHSFPDPTQGQSWYCSIAMDNLNHPHISYYQAGVQDLKYAYHDGSSWSVTTPDPTDATGLHTSIAVTSSNIPWIAYYDQGSNKINCIYKNTGSFSYHAEISDGTLGISSGRSLALNSAGNIPHIVYKKDVGGRYQLKYYDGLSYDGSSSIVIDGFTGGSYGNYASIALDSNNNPHIAYNDESSGSNYSMLKYAYYDGSGWHGEYVDTTNNCVGRYNCIALDSNNRPHISYYDHINGNLLYAYRDGSGWHTQIVDSSGDVGSSTSIAIDSNDYPHISYDDITNRAIKYATPIYPTVTTTAATGVGTTSATLNMSYDFKDYSSGWVQFAYKKTTDGSWTYNSWVAKSGAGSYGEAISSLSSNTTYQFKARLKYDTIQEIDGSVLTFTTSKVIPTVTTNAATGTTDNSTTLNMSYDFKDYSSGTVRFTYKKTSDGGWTYTSPQAKSGSGNYSVSPSGLSPYTQYQFQALLTYNGSETSGSVLTFTTLPTVTTNAATSVATTSARLNMSYGIGDLMYVEVQFAYKKTTDGGWTYTDPWEPKLGGFGSSYYKDVSGLSSNTEYQFKARLKYDVTSTPTMIEGSVLTFTTLRAIPTVTTNAATVVTPTSAIINMSYDFKDYSPGQVQFGYKKTADSTWTYTSWVDKSGANTYAEGISSLSSNTEYQFKARLKYDSSEIEGSTLTFTTERTPPTITTQAATGIGTSSATLNMSYTVGDYSSVDVCFAYKKSTDSTWTNTSWTSKSASGTHSESLSGVESSTQYDLKAQIRYNSTVIEGTTLQFTTQRIGTASVAAATGTGTATFTINNGSISNLTAANSTPCGTLSGLSFPHGFFNFTITGIPTGSTVTITITLPSNMPTGTQYWKCINGTWVDCTSLLGDNDGDNILTLTIRDGGLGDSSPTPDGMIVDPGGPALPVSGATVPAQPAHRASPTPPNQFKRAQMSLQYLNVNPQQAAANQPVNITTNVVNTGDEAGNLNVALKINGQVEQSRMVSVGPQGTQPVKFTLTRAQPGTYAVDIGGQKGSFTILGTGSGTPGSPANGGLIAILIIGALIIATVAVLMLTFRRSTG